MLVSAGPDGFVATSEAADYAANAALTQYLSERQEIGNKALEDALRRLRKQLSRRELILLIRAIHQRIGWIAEHESELSEPRHWQDFLAQLARNLYSPKLPFEDADLILLLESHRKHRALWTFGPEELLIAFIEKHDLSPDLAAELRRFQAELTGAAGKMKYQNQAGYQVAVQHVHMLLWHDENDPLDVSRCWSEVIRRDLRAMSAEPRVRWKALLRHIKGNAPAKPSKGWLKEAEQRLAAVGQAEFLDRLALWFAPFRSGEPQHLSVAGSHVLRGLVWHLSLVDGPAALPLVTALLDAAWKAKRNVDKTMVALVPILEKLPAAEAWPHIQRLQQKWPANGGQIEDLLRKTAAELGISADDLRARGLLKTPPDIGDVLDKVMDRMQAAKFMIGILGPHNR